MDREGACLTWPSRGVEWGGELGQDTMSLVPHQGSWEELNHTPPSLYPSPPPPQAPKSWENLKSLCLG